ncbi:MAG: ribonuclease catalytic domain-containing protein [Betaproteobacteria bacterium]
MHLLFEEDGSFKAGTVLSGTDNAFQVELPSGKRTKVKASHVVLRFEQPPPGQLIKDAQAGAEDIDLDFLWECAPQDEFGFEELAREYHGTAASSVQAASVLLRLHGAPVYFHRKGRGRFRPAPAEILRQALAAVERKRQQELARQHLVDELKAGRLPAAIAAAGAHLLARPDKQSIEYKAVEQAAAELQVNMLALLLARGAIASPYRWHLGQFLATTFPRGTGFSADLPAPALPPDLPVADVVAFSIDDSATTEIDDAFSVQTLDSGWRIGIHIAAPAVAITRDHALDAVAKARMSTVYAPGLKFTMLPDPWVDAFSLNEGRVVPVVSLYVEIDSEFNLRATDTRVEQVKIAANLRHDLLDEVVTPEAVAAGVVDAPFGAELVLLWRFARALMARREAVRGRPEPLGRIDYGFELDFAGAEPDEHAHVRIKPRKRGAPLDLIVAELMILANSHWGGWLKQKKVAGVYRSQRRVMGVSRVKMSTTPAPHEGIGVDHYAWSSSPLRRYVDLVNQRQIVAAARGVAPAYAASDAELFAIVSGFDAAYTHYAEFQERLERYWCLRWLKQENLRRIAAAVVKGDLLRFDGLPLLTRVPGLPELPRGQRLELDLLGLDEVNLSIEARLHQLLAQQVAEEALEDEEEAVVDETAAPPAESSAEAIADPAQAVRSDAAEGTIPQAS